MSPATAHQTGEQPAVVVGTDTPVRTPRGHWSGPCVRKSCGEHAGTVAARGLNYSWPAECGAL